MSIIVTASATRATGTATSTATARTAGTARFVCCKIILLLPLLVGHLITILLILERIIPLLICNRVTVLLVLIVPVIDEGVITEVPVILPHAVVEGPLRIGSACQIVSLGKRILRAETAAITALSMCGTPIRRPS